MSEIPNLQGALQRLASAIRSVGLPFAIIGGLAVILRGYERTTQDVDAVVKQLVEHLEALLETAALNELQFRISNGLEFASRNRA